MRNFDTPGAFYEDSVDKQWVIVFDDGEITNADIIQEEFSLHESLCGTENLRFGSCESAHIQLKVANVFNSMLGKKLTVYLHVGEDIMLVGSYIVDEDVRSTDRAYRNIVAHDVMYTLLNDDITDWYNEQTFPMTVREFRNLLFSHWGVVQETMSLVNDNISIAKTLGGRITGADVLIPLCEINGVFGHITPAEKFTYVTLERLSDLLVPSNSLHPDDTLYPKDVGILIPSACGIDGDYSDFNTQGITKVIARVGNVDTESGTDGNTYLLTENPFTLSMASTSLQNLVNNLCGKISGYYFQPFEITVVGNPCMEVGDRITMNWRNGIIRSYVLERDLKGIQSLRDSLSAKGEEVYPVEINNYASSIKALNSITNRLERTSEQTLSEIEDLENDLRSEISQTASSISAKVTKGTSYNGMVISDSGLAISGDGAFTVDMSNFKLDSSGKATLSNVSMTTRNVMGVSNGVDVSSSGISASWGVGAYLNSDGTGLSAGGGAVNGSLETLTLNSSGFSIGGGKLSTYRGENRVYAPYVTSTEITTGTLNATTINGSVSTASTAYGLSGSPSISVSGISASGRINCYDWYSNSQSSYSANAYITSNGYIRRKESSSERYKEEISDAIPEELNPQKLYNIPIKTYKYCKGIIDEADQRVDATHIGFIAEDVEREYPIACDKIDGKAETWNSMYMIPAMLKLIQEQNERIIALERRVENLEQSV